MSESTDPLVNPWHPMTDPVDLKITGKFIEELGECISAVARCQMQGIDERHPLTGKRNRYWLEDEIADVKAQMQHIIERFRLNEEVIEARQNQKYTLTGNWHRMA